MHDGPLLIVFVKAARPGAVKTRLAADIGHAAACGAYQTVVEAVLRAIASLQNVQLRFSPDDAQAEIAPWRRPGWTLAPQGEGNLGERLHAAFADAFAAGCHRVAIIGSDCPYVTANDIEQAWTALDLHDVVLGPACDGGYWIVALRSPTPALFENIPWGAGSVLERTLDVARDKGLRVKLLRELADIDTVEDWRAFLGRSVNNSDRAH